LQAEAECVADAPGILGVRPLGGDDERQLLKGGDGTRLRDEDAPQHRGPALAGFKDIQVRGGVVEHERVRVPDHHLGDVRV
jgi:hypothetical protein